MEKVIDKIKRKLLIKYPFFGNVVANTKFVELEQCQTAGTDGQNIYYNSEFLKGLTEDKQVFVMAHEICHIAFDHVYRSEGKDKKLWNTATDAVVNALLKQDGLEIVEGGVDMPEAINYNAEQMYEKLLKEMQNQQEAQGAGKGEGQQEGQEQEENQQEGQGGSSQSGNGQQNGQVGNSNGGLQGSNQEEQEGQKNEQGGSEQNQDEKEQNAGHDTHQMWGDAIEKKKEQEQGNQSGQSNNGNESNETEKSNKDELKKAIEDIKKETKENSEKDAFNQNKEQRKKQLDELRKSLAKQSTGAGNTTNSIDRRVENIGRARALIDWRKLLKDAIQLDADWSYRNASIEDGILTSHLEEMPKPETEIVLDTSGSIDEVLLKNFLRECKNILEESKVKVGCFDTEFYGFEELRKIEDIDKMKFEGGGGTDFDVAVNAFTRRVENKIIFTDGEAQMPKKELNAIWVVFGNEEIHPKGGRVISITDKELKRLYNFEINKSIDDDFER